MKRFGQTTSSAVIVGRINADDALKVVFSDKKQVSRFEMKQTRLCTCKISA